MSNIKRITLSVICCIAMVLTTLLCSCLATPPVAYADELTYPYVKRDPYVVLTQSEVYVFPGINTPFNSDSSVASWRIDFISDRHTFDPQYIDSDTPGRTVITIADDEETSTMQFLRYTPGSLIWTFRGSGTTDYMNNDFGFRVSLVFDDGTEWVSPVTYSDTPVPEEVTVTGPDPVDPDPIDPDPVDPDPDEPIEPEAVDISALQDRLDKFITLGAEQAQAQQYTNALLAVGCGLIVALIMVSGWR